MLEKIDVTRCQNCVYFIANTTSNVGHCTMWNQGVMDNGFCYRGEVVPIDENECISCGAIVPEGRLICPLCEGRFT